MRFETKEGEQEFTLDFDKVCAYESEHPDWSLILEMRKFGKTLRFSTLDLLASFCHEGGWKAWTSKGLTIGDLTKVLNEGLNELGFSSEADQ